MESAPSHIDWAYSGRTDLAFGTGATRAERALGWTGALMGLALVGYFYAIGAYPWAFWQYALAAFLGMDVVGGVVANSLNSGKRFYHTLPQPGESALTRLLKHHALFAALHIHPILVGLLFGATNWLYAGVWYVALVGATLLVLAAPLYLRRPLAMLLIVLALLGNTYLVPGVAGFEWLVPALFLKIVYGHAVREEPYRP